MKMPMNPAHTGIAGPPGSPGRRRHGAWLGACLLALLAASPVLAQAPTKPPPPPPVEEEGREKATPTKPRPVRDAEKPPPPVLLLSSDMDVRVELDGEPIAELQKNVVERIRISPGEHLLQAFPRGIEEGPTWKESVKAPETGTVTAIIELQEIVAEWLADQEEEEESRFEVAEDTVLDRESGLLWTRRVSPAIRWQDARTWCQNLDRAGRTGWRLPKLDELSKLYWPDHPEPLQETMREKGKLTIFGRVKGEMETLPRLIHEPFEQNSVSALWVESQEDRVACTFLGEFGCSVEGRKDQAGILCVIDPEP